MKYLTWSFLLLVFCSAGCAHSPAETPPLASAAQNPQTTLSTNDQAPSEVDEAVNVGVPHDDVGLLDERTEKDAVDNDQTPSDQGTVEAEFLDDDLDFLDEETEEEVVSVADPLAPWNRLMFQFNDKLYFWFLKPVSTGYKAVVPGPVRSGVQNFFTNLGTPIRMAGCILQGKGHEAQVEFVRFWLNSTVGVLGLGDPAKNYPELDLHDEDMGQTLATYGVGDGFYVVWPVLGPSTLRDTAGSVGDLFMNPVSYLPIGVSAGMSGEHKLNQASFRTGDYESLKEAALDPYEAVRDAYIQHRKTKVEE